MIPSLSSKIGSSSRTGRISNDPVTLVEHRVFVEHRVLEELASDPVTPIEHRVFVEKRVFVKYLIFVEHRA